MKQNRRIPCEVYSRIVGYLRPLQSWSKHKQLEFSERKTYVIEHIETKGESMIKE